MKIVYTVAECTESAKLIAEIAGEFGVPAQENLLDMLRANGGFIDTGVGNTVRLDETAQTVTVEYEERLMLQIYESLRALKPIIKKVGKVVMAVVDIWEEIGKVKLPTPPMTFGSTAGIKMPTFTPADFVGGLEMEEISEDEKATHKVCVECGSKNAIDDKFCFHCGTAFR